MAVSVAVVKRSTPPKVNVLPTAIVPSPVNWIFRPSIAVNVSVPAEFDALIPV